MTYCGKIVASFIYVYFLLFIMIIYSKFYIKGDFMNQYLIYVCDDEENIRNIIESFLVNEGYGVETFDNGQSLINAFTKKSADMIIVDIMMPGIDGYTVCTSIRQLSNVPIIIVSAKDTEPDKIIGLNLGSDDYLTKPFSPLELVARVKSIFRRMDFDSMSNSADDKVVKIEDVKLYVDSNYAECNDKDLKLTVMEYNLLYYLIQKRNKAVSRNELLSRIWQFDEQVETRAPDDMIKRIRKKLKTASSNLSIETVWGYGYKIKDKQV